MQRISRAPVLSAILRRDSCWIIESPRSPGGLHDLGQAPALRLGQRTRLDDADDVADLRLVLLVVRVELDAAPDDLLVALVRADQLDLDDDRLVHRARDDDATALLAPATVMLRLRLADDRLALSARGGATARLLRAQAARQPLPLLLRLGLGRRSRFLGGGLFSGRRLYRGLLYGLRFLSSRFLDRSLGFHRGLLTRLRRSRSLLNLFFVFLVLAHEAVFAFSASRSLTAVRIRAISRFASFRRAWLSIAPVTDWKRRLNSS